VNKRVAGKYNIIQPTTVHMPYKFTPTTIHLFYGISIEFYFYRYLCEVFTHLRNPYCITLVVIVDVPSTPNRIFAVMTKTITSLLANIVHPESEKDIVSSGFVSSVEEKEGSIIIVLDFKKAHDPFANKIKRQVEQLLCEQLRKSKEEIVVTIKQTDTPTPERHTFTNRIGKIIAVSSGKGGVGKSTVTANLALALHHQGYRVGILDADIYGPSQPKLFGVEGYQPDVEIVDGVEAILPAEVQGIQLMSIGFFIKPSDALIWRDAMATNALRQMIHQTMWGGLDFLLIDLPPGTGGVHLTIISELTISGAIVISTPQQVALADVRRGVELFRADKINIPIIGIIENMAWFTPKELPNNRYYLFGKGGAKLFAEENHIHFLGEIPIIQSVMNGCEQGKPAIDNDKQVASYYQHIAKEVVYKLM
jgi:ATP-binding protein involved in chromosome partitioning